MVKAVHKESKVIKQDSTAPSRTTARKKARDTSDEGKYAKMQQDSKGRVIMDSATAWK